MKTMRSCWTGQSDTTHMEGCWGWPPGVLDSLETPNKLARMAMETQMERYTAYIHSPCVGECHGTGCVCDVVGVIEDARVVGHSLTPSLHPSIRMNG